LGFSLALNDWEHFPFADITSYEEEPL
jgi:hypothetical protein